MADANECLVAGSWVAGSGLIVVAGLWGFVVLEMASFLLFVLGGSIVVVLVVVVFES